MIITLLSPQVTNANKTVDEVIFAMKLRIGRS